MNMHHITTDVLIMGGGSAGLWAAYRCSELALKPASASWTRAPATGAV